MVPPPQKASVTFCPRSACLLALRDVFSLPLKGLFVIHLYSIPCGPQTHTHFRLLAKAHVAPVRAGPVCPHGGTGYAKKDGAASPSCLSPGHILEASCGTLDLGHRVNPSLYPQLLSSSVSWNLRNSLVQISGASRVIPETSG